MKVDYLACTRVPDRKRTLTFILSEIRAYFESVSLTWLELDRGAMGYTRSAKVGSHIRVFWSPDNPRMGVHVNLPASGLAEIGASPESLVVDLFHLGYRFSRVDIAGDDFDGRLNLVEIARKLESGEFVSRAKIGREQRSLFGSSGRTIYVGNRQSDTFGRIYDKSAEQADQHKGVYSSWVRCELEFKNERAHAVAIVIATNPEGWREKAEGWFRSFLEFKERGEDSHKSRWQVSEWWVSFLNNAAKLRLEIVKASRSLEDLRQWVQDQVVPSLFALGKTLGYDVLFEDILKGEVRVSERLQSMMESYQLRMGLSSFTP